MWCPGDPEKLDTPLWEYVIELKPSKSEQNPERTQNEIINLIFRNRQVAMTSLKAIKEGKTIDFKKSHPELFL
jgi:hypothetical protein